MTEFDAAEIVHDVAELYEPLADEKGLALKVEAEGPVPVNGQPRADQPGARQPARQRDQVCGAQARGAGAGAGSRRHGSRSGARGR